IPQERLIIYYTKNPYFLYYYTKIYNPPKDIIIEIVKRALKDLLKKLLRRRIRKKKAVYTGDRGFKKSKE
ncbi:hypothetical protein V2W45_1228984, partial [Cenococcum geophilum]